MNRSSSRGAWALLLLPVPLAFSPGLDRVSAAGLAETGAGKWYATGEFSKGNCLADTKHSMLVERPALGSSRLGQGTKVFR